MLFVVSSATMFVLSSADELMKMMMGVFLLLVELLLSVVVPSMREDLPAVMWSRPAGFD